MNVVKCYLNSSKVADKMELVKGKTSVVSKMWLVVIFVGLTSFTLTSALGGFEGQVCRGTTLGLTHQGTDLQRYNRYKEHYTNCTYVDGNLEIVFLRGMHDLSFLKDIKEVTGYVLIVSVFTDYIPLTSLRIIRGRTQYNDQGKFYSLYVALNYDPEKGTGLKELRFTSLYEILDGDVYFYHNLYLCHESHVNWRDILAGEGATMKVNNRYSNASLIQRPCPSCHSSCAYSGKRYCWGDGPKMCQKLTRLICSRQCEGRCFGRGPHECCNSECAGGCLGPTRQECWACKNFNNDNSCLPYCPPPEIYEPSTYSYVPNPNAKYTYGTLCMDECPEYMKIDKGACVLDCREGRIANENRVCVDCEGPCPKTCEAPDEMISSKNIAQFKGCTMIKGNIKIHANTFSGDTFLNIEPMHPSELSVFETVKEVNGYVSVEAEHDDFRNLSCLRNLEVIHGRGEFSEFSLQIYNSTLEALHLNKLHTVKNQMVLITHNPYLCYADTINWSKIVEANKKKIFVKRNGNRKQCESEGRMCHPECADGCWGAGNENCMSCAHYRYGRMCVPSCLAEMGVYHAGNLTCEPCHSECKDRCIGKGPMNCEQCAHMKDGPFCVAQCPIAKYADENNVCQMCHANCKPDGCSGPLNTVGPGACNACAVKVLDRQGNLTKCLPPNSKTCETGYYMRTNSAGFKVCRPCHPECRTCTGPTLSYCETCMHYEQDQKCISNCTSDYYVDHGARRCVRCNPLCLQCRGPTATDCITCKQYKVYYDSEDGTVPLFNCTATCPDSLPYKITESFNGLIETVCTAHASDSSEVIGRKPRLGVGVIIGVSFAGIAVLFAAGIGLAYYFNKRAVRQEKKLRLAARMSGLDSEEIEPLTPTNAKPDMTTLRLIKESELRKGNIIGSGAFGTVFKGAWLPEGENVKMPVAIKVLQEGTSPSQNQELLDEARIMFSVQHPCCSRILAVCLTAQMMLITQLMPLGCLLDYVRQHRNNISSKVLLNWCTQIAKGMLYLEERGIVHRDLAARNVLVQNALQVKITDFGLAKLLDYNEEEFHATSGKMPIKWLALECIQHRIFTHKSDVWSYGVTLWELFTYGQRPYENVRARDMPDLLEKGERLPQPSITTIDIYMIMIKCWMLDAQSRPSFRDLAEEFAKMSRDPGRYLVIQGDKFMRLPSQNYNTKDLMRNLSIADGPEVVVDAEEYLNPEPSPAETTAETQPTNSKEYDNDRIENAPAASDPTSPSTTAPSSHHLSPPESRRDPRYAGLESAAAAKKQRDLPARDSVNSRYSADPCKLVSGDEMAEKGDELLPPPPPTPLTKEPDNGKTDGSWLPFDEDDYLQPRSTHPAAYMDLVDGKDYLTPEETSFSEADTSRTPLYPQVPPLSLQAENPEYFDSPSSPPASRPKDGPVLRPNTKQNPAKPPVKPKPNYYNLVGARRSGVSDESPV